MKSLLSNLSNNKRFKKAHREAVKTVLQTIEQRGIDRTGNSTVALFHQDLNLDLKPQLHHHKATQAKLKSSIQGESYHE